MKLVFRQYLASLRERKELDAVLPDLLSELGYTVISRPSIGTRQYGVDVAALSNPKIGKRKLYLFSIKQGDLTRADWDGTPQALRSSINDIIDVYIPTRVSKSYEKLDVVICLCFGGDIQESVRDNVTMFTSAQTTSRISFEEWNGDYLAGLLVDGILREQLLDKALRASFQKAVAMVDEPDVAFQHFSSMIRHLCGVGGATPRQRATIVRQVYICLWVLFVWARDAGNLEAPYRAGELALLQTWHLIREDVGKDTVASQEVSAAFTELCNLHDLIWDGLLGEKILPHVDVQHGISGAVNSASPVDVNLKLFEIMSRIALRGLWMLWAKSGPGLLPEARSDWDAPEARALADQIVQLVRNNPILMTPISDAHSIDIATTVLFLMMMESKRAVTGNYVSNIINRTTFAYRTHGRYPTIHDEYRELIEHPREQTDGYRQAQTKGSTLFPLLFLWASALGEAESAEYLIKFREKYLTHCNLQLWLVDVDTEESIYVGDTRNGATLNDLPITSDVSIFDVLKAECAGATPFSKLSAIRYGHWPIIVLACRHYRLPLPPNLFLPLLLHYRAKLSVSSAAPIRATKAKLASRLKRAK